MPADSDKTDPRRPVKGGAAGGFYPASRKEAAWDARREEAAARAARQGARAAKGPYRVWLRRYLAILAVIVVFVVLLESRAVRDALWGWALRLL